MVFIESVELTNFKSYHHERHIGPFLQTNAIVGPNGTGKSNILDAITFAFGDISKNLRVDRLKDLIHTSSTDDSEASCAVSVRLTFPSEEKVYEFERRLRRSGADEFFINNEKTNKQDYIDFLEKRGIFAKHDNFVIRQGSINKMIQDGDNNRTKFIDVVSGSSNFDQQCKEYQKTYEDLVKKLRDHQDSAQQTGTELHRLSVAHGKRKDIEEDLQKLAETRTDYYLLQMYPVETELENLNSKFQKQKAKLEKDLTEPEDELHDAQIQKQEEVYTVLAETKQIKATKSLADSEYATAKTQMDGYNQQMSFLQNKVSTNEKMLKTLQVKSQEKQDDRKEIERKIAELQKELNSLEAEYRRESQSALNENELAQFYELSRFVDEDKVSDELRIKEEKLEILRKELESFKGALQMEEEKLTAKRRELSLLETNDPQQIELDSVKAQVTEIEKDIEKIKANDMRKAQYTREFEEIQYKLADRERTVEYNNKERMRDQIERELLESFPGLVFGILKNICAPIDESYTLAGARVFQKWKNAFVVDSGETAGLCINYLKQKRHPTQKFIPVDDSLRIRQITPDVRAVLNKNKARLVRDCFNIRHENPIVGRAVDFVCGTILICDTAQEADDCAYNQGSRLTTVSKDGTLFNRNGKITGGSASLTQHGDPFNPTQVQTMVKRKAELTDLLRAIPRSEGLILEKQARINQLQKFIDQLEKARPGLANDRAKRIEDINRFIQNIQAALDEKRGMIELTETKIQETENEIQELKARKEALTKETFAEFCKRNKIKDLSAFQNEDVQLQKRFSEKKTKLTNEIKNLQNELQYITDTRTNERTQAEARLQSAKEEYDKLLKVRDKAREECDKKHSEFVKAHTDLEEREKELETLISELQDIKARIKKIKDVHNKLKKLSKERDTNFDNLMDTLQRIFFECRIKQIALPLTNGNFENVELFEPGDSDPISSSHGSRIALFECKADYSRFNEVHDQLSDDEGRKKLVTKKTKEIAELERQLTVKESGALSVEDFNERIVKAREAEKENMAKFNVLSKNLTEARRRLEDTKTERKNLFMTTLKKMQKDVDYYYKLLYHDATAQAYLNIVGSDEPYNSKVLFDLIVPGKSRNSIDALSGGEKAMAILALLFAGKPKNVNCILMDEFDEALDRRNMLLVSRFIDTMSTRGIQFIFISHRLELYAYANRLIGSSIHCENACNFGSIVFTVDVRDYLGEIGRKQYDPDDEEELERKREANEQFAKAIEIKDDGTPVDERTNAAKVEQFMHLYGNQEVKDFLKATDEEDAFKKCQNNQDVQDLKDLFTRMTFENF